MEQRRVYLAARFSRRNSGDPPLQKVRDLIASANIVCTSRWIDDGPQTDDVDENSTLAAVRDRHDIYKASELWAFTEPSRSTTSRGGRHAEYGMALAHGKHLVCIGPIENIFYQLANEHWDTWDEFWTHLRNGNEKA